MKSIFKVCSTVILVLIVLSFLGVEPFATYKGELLDKADTSVEKLPDTEKGGYALIFNKYRVEYRLAPLAFTDDLNRIAALRLTEIRSNFSHNSGGKYNKYLAENIVTGVHSNKEALSSWKNSIRHRINMQDEEYRNTGYATGGGYAVQVFSEWNTVNGVPELPPGWFFAD